MTNEGAVLEAYNNELIKCIEDLYMKQDELNRQILMEEEERERLQQDILLLSEKLSQVKESLEQILSIRADLDQFIAETNAEYAKILEISPSLQNILNQEVVETEEEAKMAEMVEKVETEEEAEMAEMVEKAETEEEVETAETVEKAETVVKAETAEAAETAKNLDESPVE